MNSSIYCNMQALSDIRTFTCILKV